MAYARKVKPTVEPPMARLSARDRERLLRAIHYLNMQELHGFCDAHDLAYRIRVESADGHRVRTRDLDRKGVVIDRVVHYLVTGARKPETVFPKAVVATAPLGRPPKPTDRVLYGRYRNGDPDILALMKGLTDGRFRFGAVAQEVLRACWSSGDAPTYGEFAVRWEQAVGEHDEPNPEWAYLSDLAHGTAGDDWKGKREREAQVALRLLREALGDRLVG
jgi:hypothetical protein